MTNKEVCELLRKIAAAYQILEENRFKIIAYERAADSIEHLTSEVKDLWDDGKLGEIPGVGKAIAGYFDELFQYGKVKHFEMVMKKVPEAVFPLLSVPGIGPKKAYKLVTTLKLKSAETVVEDLKKAARAGRIAPIEGFGEKSQEDILEAIATYRRGQIKENRMELPLADAIAQDVIVHLKKHPAVERADALGSLRRQVATIGDIDIAVATKKPSEAIDHFLRYPHQKLIEKGPTGASLLLSNGRQVDLRVQGPQAYGAMLQYFTGSKHHNIKLREYALAKGKSLSEYGIKVVKTGKLKKFATEEEFYKSLGMPWIPPELREDKGEIEAALRLSRHYVGIAQGKPANLPQLVGLHDVKGDLHIHTNYNLEPSHDLGANTLSEHLDKAAALGYEYLGISDHNPSITDHSLRQIVDIMKRRKAAYEHQYSSWSQRTKKRTHLLIMCEVDVLPDGKLALPDEAFEYVDAVITAVHSSFNQPKERMTQRILKGLTGHPKVRILGHPTGRLLGRRESYEVDWDKLFAVCKKEAIALEINAYPQRLDLPDTLVYDAVKAKIPLCINTDAHAVDQMDVMRYGVSVARRGWAQKDDIVNTLGYNAFSKWFLNK